MSGKKAEISMEKPFDDIRKSSALFGYIAIKKGYATEQQIKYVLAKQQRLFREKNIQQMVGDMLVESGVLTKEQHQVILKYQQAATVDKEKTDNKKIVEKTDEQNQINQTSQINDSGFNNELIKIDISSDSMEAWVQIVPPFNELEDKVTLLQVKSELKKQGVADQILSDSILQSHINRKDELFLAAVGHYGYGDLIEYQFDINIKPPPIINDTLIKRNKTLAFVKSNKSNQVKIQYKDVFGKTSAADRDASFPLRCGMWCSIPEEDSSRVISDQSGYPALSIEGKLYIFPVVNVLEDADLRFGPVDPYANLNVTGVLTGAYPVNAGQIQAREIRGAVISSIGGISAEIGITRCRIKTQGSVKAKYIHNCRIEAFGDVVVEHEIIDSTIVTSGHLDVSKGRIVASRIFAKMGVSAARVGSKITEPCRINIGSEEHIVLQSLEIRSRIINVQKELDDLIRQKESVGQQIKDTFKQMVELKAAHDRVKSKLNQLADNINTAAEQTEIDLADKEELQKNELLSDSLKNKMQAIVEELKIYNQQKKRLETNLEQMDKKIISLKPKVEHEIMELQIDRNRFLKWAEIEKPNPEIKIFGRLSEGTVIKGLFSSITVKEDIIDVHITEKKVAGISISGDSGTSDNVTQISDNYEIEINPIK